jgi:Lon protease-like protein
VLFPGAPLPLHVFEPRYRRLLADCLSGDRIFGVICRPEGVPEREIPSGTVGCLAYIESEESLEDGRANIVVTGRERFALERFVADAAPYHVGEVTSVSDDEESELVLEPLAMRVRRVFDRVGRAARTIADDASPLPALPDDAAKLSFTIAQYVDLDLRARQGLLSSRSPAARLRQILDLLGGVVDAIEQRARTHQRARTNGHGAYGGTS